MKKTINTFRYILLITVIIFLESGISTAYDKNSGDERSAMHFSIHVGSGNQAGATVTVKNTSGTVLLGPGTTDASGWVTFIGAPLTFGTYIITAVKGQVCVNQEINYSYWDQAFYVTLGACQD